MLLYAPFIVDYRRLSDLTAQEIRCYEDTMKTMKNKQIFIGHLKEKYGRRIFNDLENLSKDFNLTLTWLGDKYGFTREYARQIFFRYYGFEYSKKVRNRVSRRKKEKERIRKQDFHLYYDPKYKVRRLKRGSKVLRGAIAELKAKEICKYYKYKITITPEKSIRLIDLIVNDLFCEVKSTLKSYKTSNISNNAYFVCNFKPKQKEKADFLFWYIYSINTFYVIPSLAFPKGQSLYIPETGIPHRYSEYKEAWHLLDPKELI